MFSILIFFSFSDNCNEMKPYQMLCFNDNNNQICDLDEDILLNCTVFHSTICKGERNFILPAKCRYCYQVDPSSIDCEILTDCEPSLGSYFTKCHSNTPCIGASIFQKRAQCMKSSKSQKTAFLLSLFLGGVAADRFYLGHYVSAAFKLITFGGLGIAYMIDLFLILFGYLGPADGSLFPERI